MFLLFQLNIASFVIFFWASSIALSEQSGPSYFFYQQAEYPRDCNELRHSCNTQIPSGIFLIKPDGYHKPFEVYCDNDSESGGWTVIQRRLDGSLIFKRDWTAYKVGFGFLSQEFWIGNEKLSFLTNQNTNQLRIDFTFSDGSSFFIAYTLFRIGDEFSGYTLAHLGFFSGRANITNCSNDKDYLPCTCERSCEHPDVCFLNCTEDEECICPNGFYVKGEECVQPEDCGCFLDGNIIPEGGVHVVTDCSRRCVCSAGQLVCDEGYQCSSNAVCEERDGLQQCYCNSGFIGDGVSCTSSSPATDCLDVFNRVNTDNGVYNITPTTWSGSPFEVYCNMTDGGGWTVFQRRVDGTVNFDLYWEDFKEGFGTPDHEHWLGNQKIFSLTNQRRYQLRIDFVNQNGVPYYAKYDFFRINNEANNYRLTVETYSDGDAGDSLTSSFNNNQDFSTRDRDNDDRRDHLAADSSWGAWWYGYSHGHAGYSDLNAPRTSDRFWQTLPGRGGNIKFTEMKVRPV